MFQDLLEQINTDVFIHDGLQPILEEKSWEEISLALYQILDNISTADDAFKENTQGFRKFVMKHQAEKNRYLHSLDGQKVVQVNERRWLHRGKKFCPYCGLSQDECKKCYAQIGERCCKKCELYLLGKVDIREDSNKILYHVSEEYLGKTVTMKPRIASYMKGGFGEDITTPRVSLSTSVMGALAGIDLVRDGAEFYIYKLVNDPKLYVPTKDQVGDVEVTGEVWALSLAKLQFVSKAKIIYKENSKVVRGHPPGLGYIEVNEKVNEKETKVRKEYVVKYINVKGETKSEVVKVVNENLVPFAQKELQLAGLFDKDSDYEGIIAEAVMELIQAFAKQDHSGCSAGMTLDIFDKLAKFKPLTELTDSLDEWMEIGSQDPRTPTGTGTVWQSKRSPTCFSEDGGKTYYDLDECDSPDQKIMHTSKHTEKVDEGMQSVGYVTIGGDKLKVLFRDKKYERCLKLRTTGQDGVHLADEEIHLARNPDLLADLRAGKVVCM